MSDLQKDLEEEADEEFYGFVLAQMREGRDKAEIIQNMVDKGVNSEEATPLIEKIHDDLVTAAREQEFTPDTLIPVIIGGILAAAIGGAIWGLIVIVTNYELGFVAWGLGGLSGYAVVLFSKGRRGTILQVTAVLSSLLGIVTGKYITFCYFLKEAIEEQHGVQATEEITWLSGKVIQIFLDDFGTMLGGFDILWVVLAVTTAWKIPKGIGIKLPERHPWQS